MCTTPSERRPTACTILFEYDFCVLLSDGLEPVRAAVERHHRFILEFNSCAEPLLSIRRPLFEIYKLSINAIWRALTGFFDLIYNLLRPFINLLEYKICVWVPIPIMRYYNLCTVSCVTACRQSSRSR